MRRAALCPPALGTSPRTCRGWPAPAPPPSLSLPLAVADLGLSTRPCCCLLEGLGGRGWGPDPRLWLLCESSSSSTSSTLAAFFSLLLFFCVQGGPSQGHRPGISRAQGVPGVIWGPGAHAVRWACLSSAAPFSAGEPSDQRSGHWPVWVRGHPLGPCSMQLTGAQTPRLQLPGSQELRGGSWEVGPGNWGLEGPLWPAQGQLGTWVQGEPRPRSPPRPCAWRSRSQEAGRSVCWPQRPPQTPGPPQPGRGTEGPGEHSVRPGGWGQVALPGGLGGLSGRGKLSRAGGGAPGGGGLLLPQVPREGQEGLMRSLRQLFYTHWDPRTRAQCCLCVTEPRVGGGARSPRGGLLPAGPGYLLPTQTRAPPPHSHGHPCSPRAMVHP